MGCTMPHDWRVASNVFLHYYFAHHQKHKGESLDHINYHRTGASNI